MRSYIHVKLEMGLVEGEGAECRHLVRERLGSTLKEYD